MPEYQLTAMTPENQIAQVRFEYLEPQHLDFEGEIYIFEMELDQYLNSTIA